MNTPLAGASDIRLGYVILYVENVAESLAFYEEAFGLARRVLHEEGGHSYGELETGAARLAFVNLEMARTQLKREVIAASADGPPAGFEIALVTSDVQAVYDRAVGAGATPVSEPTAKPWGQTVAYLRDPDGNVIELCTPLD